MPACGFGVGDFRLHLNEAEISFHAQLGRLPI
jgi:hypothetical protein